jgi:SagB-type dehydrogenase family enzyme
MAWTALGNPVPRTRHQPYTPVEWVVRERIALPAVGPLGTVDIHRLFGERRTRRSFNPTTLGELSSLLWLTARVQQTVASDLGFPLTHRPCPSGGSIHPIHLVFQLDEQSGLVRYDPWRHDLAVLPHSEELASSMRSATRTLVVADGSTLVAQVAEPGKTFAKYTEASSVVWRDAGVQLGYLALAAQTLSMQFCPLGITGDPWASQLDQQGRLVGVGMGVIGGCA